MLVEMKNYRIKDSSPQQPSPPPVQRALKQRCQSNLFYLSRPGHGVNMFQNLPAVCSPRCEGQLQTCISNTERGETHSEAEEVHESRRTTGLGGLSLPRSPDLNAVLPFPCLSSS